MTDHSAQTTDDGGNHARSGDTVIGRRLVSMPIAAGST
jgi:hypothetical protein